MEQSLYLDSINTLIKNRVDIFNTKNSITNRNSLLPTNQDYPLKDNYWFQVEDVISIFVDIRGSTNLSANNHDIGTASVYELFTGTAIRIFHEMGAEYIDVKGDGVFALFSKNKIYTALASAITFKTFAKNTFKKLVDKKLSGKNIDIGFHMGIDQKTVLVKQIGIKNHEDRGDIRKNEVWAGKPINMSAKLASLSTDGELYVSDRFFKNLNNNELVIKSCGCSNGEETGNKEELWIEVDLSNDDKFDFNKAYILKSIWCSSHGKEWCKKIIALDSN